MNRRHFESFASHRPRPPRAKRRRIWIEATAEDGSPQIAHARLVSFTRASLQVRVRPWPKYSSAVIRCVDTTCGLNESFAAELQWCLPDETGATLGFAMAQSAAWETMGEVFLNNLLEA